MASKQYMKSTPRNRDNDRLCMEGALEIAERLSKIASI